MVVIPSAFLFLTLQKIASAVTRTANTATDATIGTTVFFLFFFAHEDFAQRFGFPSTLNQINWEQKSVYTKERN